MVPVVSYTGDKVRVRVKSDANNQFGKKLRAHLIRSKFVPSGKHQLKIKTKQFSGNESGSNLLQL